MKGGAKVVVEKHRHEGIFVARGKEDALVTKNMVVGESVYGEKRSTSTRAAVLFPRPRRARRRPRGAFSSRAARVSRPRARSRRARAVAASDPGRVRARAVTRSRFPRASSLALAFR